MKTQSLKTKALILSALLCVWAPLAKSDVVKMGFGDKLQPFCFPETNSGIQVEIMREALAYRGHILESKFLPMKRIPRAFINRSIDAVMMDSGVNLEPFGGFYSEPAVIYDNVFISLSKKHIKIKGPESLKGLSVLAFPGALERFPKWLDEVNRQGNYVEVNDQSLQVLALFKQRFDLVLTDKDIFHYFMDQLVQQKKISTMTVVEHSFIRADSKDYRAAFRSKALAEDFEVGLRALKKSGRYQQIYDRYIR